MTMPLLEYTWTPIPLPIQNLQNKRIMVASTPESQCQCPHRKMTPGDIDGGG